MIPTDTIKQLVGDTTGWDENDTMSFQFYGCSKFGGQPCCVDFERGLLEIFSLDGELLVERFAIKATLEPITEV